MVWEEDAPAPTPHLEINELIELIEIIELIQLIQLIDLFPKGRWN